MNCVIALLVFRQRQGVHMFVQLHLQSLVKACPTVSALHFTSMLRRSFSGWRRFAGSSGSFNAEVNKLIGIMIRSCVYI